MTDVVTKVSIGGQVYPFGQVDTSVAAEDVSYDNTTSGMTADNVQEAIDEVNSKIEQGSGQLLIGNIQFGRQYYETSDTEGYLIGKASTYARGVYHANNTPAYATNYYSTGNGAIYNGKYYNLGKLTSSQSNNKFIVVDLDTGTLTESDVEYAYRSFQYIKGIVNNYIYTDDSSSYNSIKKFDLSFNYVEDFTFVNGVPDFIYKDKLYYKTGSSTEGYGLRVENISGTVIKTITGIPEPAYIYNDMVFCLISGDISHPIYMPMATV